MHSSTQKNKKFKNKINIVDKIFYSTVFLLKRVRRKESFSNRTLTCMLIQQQFLIRALAIKSLISLIFSVHFLIQNRNQVYCIVLKVFTLGEYFLVFYCSITIIFQVFFHRRCNLKKRDMELHFLLDYSYTQMYI